MRQKLLLAAAVVALLAILLVLSIFLPVKLRNSSANTLKCYETTGNQKPC